MTPEEPPRLSPELQAAQARLQQLRAARPAARDASSPSCALSDARTADAKTADASWKACATGAAAPNWPLLNAQKELHRRRAAVGGGSGQWPVISDQGTVVGGQWAMETPPSPLPPCSPAPLPVHPTLLMAILRHDQAAPARVWLLLRHHDTAGRGWLALDDARRLLTDAGSPLRCCGRRRLRQLLAAGEGLFWRRDDRDRLWLIAAHKVAHALDSGPMQGAPVELPVAALLGGIRSVRAAFYAAFHSGRKESPISRDTLAALSGAAGRTQLEYDRAAGVGRRRNVAVGERYSAERHQSRAWERGRAAFRFIDTAGRQGRAGGEYVAWHLPNSYEGPYARRATIGRKRLNRKLADLVIKGTPGNDGHAAERVFWPDGAAAARSYNRGPDRDAYWQRETPAGRPRVWNVMAGQGGASLPAGGRCSAARPDCGGREKRNAS